MNTLVDVIKSEDLYAVTSPAYNEKALVTTYLSSCTICGEHFLLPCDLSQHMLSHQNTRCVHSCSTCRLFSCESAAQLEDHIKECCVKTHSKKPATKRKLRCVRCEIYSFTSHHEFTNHHLFHLLSVPAPRVLLRRIPFEELATVGGSGDSGAGVGTGLKLMLRRQVSGKNNYSAVVVSGSSLSYDSDSGVETGASMSAGDIQCNDGKLNTPEHDDQGDEQVFEEQSEHIQDVVVTSQDESFYRLECEETEQDAEEVYSEADMSVGAVSEDVVPDLDEEDQHDNADISYDYEDCDQQMESSPVEEGSVLENTLQQPHLSDVERETSTVETDSPGCSDGSETEHRQTSGVNKRLSPPRLLPVAEFMQSEAPVRERLSVSAPPPALSSPQALSSLQAPRSASSDPYDTSQLVTMNLDQLLEDVSVVAAKSTDVPAADNDKSAANVTAGAIEGQPLIRMAAIAANIPDERSFRQDVAAVSSSQYQPPPPPQLLLASPVVTALDTNNAPGSVRHPPSRPPILMTGVGLPVAPHVVSSAVSSMPALIPTIAGPPQRVCAPVPTAQFSTMPTATRPLLCFVCRTVVPSVRALQEHLLTAHSSLQCTMCMFKGSSVNDLRVHCMSVHNRIPVTSVAVCTASPLAANAAARIMSVRPVGVQGRGIPGPPNLNVLASMPVRRGRPPLRMTSPAALAAAGVRLVHSGLAPSLAAAHATVLPPSTAAVTGQRRPHPNGPVSSISDSPVAKRRPNIPIQSDKSDCQVISVQRRQHGLPRIQSVEGNVAHLATESAPKHTSSNSAQSDVASVLANRGISVTPASSSSTSSTSTHPSVSIPNLPAGISLTPAASSVIVTTSSEVFAVPHPPVSTTSSTSSATKESVARPMRPPTVDLTVDNPVRPASLSCRYCPRQFTSNISLLQHEKSHSAPTVTSPMTLKCRVCGVIARSAIQLQQHVQARHPHANVEAVLAAATQQSPSVASTARQPDLVVPVFDLALVSRDQLEQLGVRGFLPVSQVNQRQGQLGLPIIGLDGLGKNGPSPRPVGFFSLGPLRHIRS